MRGVQREGERKEVLTKQGWEESWKFHNAFRLLATTSLSCHLIVALGIISPALQRERGHLAVPYIIASLLCPSSRWSKCGQLFAFYWLLVITSYTQLFSQGTCGMQSQCQHLTQLIGQTPIGIKMFKQVLPSAGTRDWRWIKSSKNEAG